MFRLIGLRIISKISKARSTARRILKLKRNYRSLLRNFVNTGIKLQTISWKMKKKIVLDKYQDVTHA